MEELVRSLQRKRTGMLLGNLLYFLLLLAVAATLLLRGEKWLLWPAGALVAAYLVLVRPMTRRYTGQVRRAILEHTVCAGMEDFHYDPGGGLFGEVVWEGHLLPASSERAFISREYITGKKDGWEITLSDVTYPIVEDGRNAMFSGTFLRLHQIGRMLTPITVVAGEIQEGIVPEKTWAMVQELGELIPGSLYLKTDHDTLTILLRGRFLGISLNPLMVISERTLGANYFPELGQAIALARKLLC